MLPVSITPTKWTARYEEILNRACLGLRPLDIARQLNYSPQRVRDLFRWEEFQKRLRERLDCVAKGLTDPQVRIDFYFSQRMAKIAEKALDYTESVIEGNEPNIDPETRIETAQDLLERFSPTSKKGGGARIQMIQQSQTTNIVPFEERLRLLREQKSANEDAYALEETG